MCHSDIYSYRLGFKNILDWEHATHEKLRLAGTWLLSLWKREIWLPQHYLHKWSSLSRSRPSREVSHVGTVRSGHQHRRTIGFQSAQPPPESLETKVENRDKDREQKWKQDAARTTPLCYLNPLALSRNTATLPTPPPHCLHPSHFLFSPQSQPLTLLSSLTPCQTQLVMHNMLLGSSPLNILPFSKLVNPRGGKVLKPGLLLECQTGTLAGSLQ